MQSSRSQVLVLLSSRTWTRSEAGSRTGALSPLRACPGLGVRLWSRDSEFKVKITNFDLIRKITNFNSEFRVYFQNKGIFIHFFE